MRSQKAVEIHLIRGTMQRRNHSLGPNLVLFSVFVDAIFKVHAISSFKTSGDSGDSRFFRVAALSVACPAQAGANQRSLFQDADSSYG